VTVLVPTQSPPSGLSVGASVGAAVGPSVGDSVELSEESSGQSTSSFIESSGDFHFAQGFEAQYKNLTDVTTGGVGLSSN